MDLNTGRVENGEDWLDVKSKYMFAVTFIIAGIGEGFISDVSL